MPPVLVLGILLIVHGLEFCCSFDSCIEMLVTALITLVIKLLLPGCATVEHIPESAVRAWCLPEAGRR